MGDDKKLETTRRDIGVSIGKALIGQIPIVGPLLSEVGDIVIPGQRSDRFADFVRDLDGRVANLGLETEEIRRRFTRPEFVDLLEEGFVQAGKAVAADRRKRIASLLAQALTEGDLDAARAKKLLFTLRDLTDEEVIILKRYAASSKETQWLEEKYPDLFGGVSQSLSVPKSERYEFGLRHGYQQTLLQSGLLRQNKGFAITPFGMMLIEFIWPEDSDE